MVKGNVLYNRRLTSKDHFQDVRHLEIQTENAAEYVMIFVHMPSLNVYSYSAGDVLIIVPKNTAIEVDFLLSIVGWESIADKPFHITPSYPGTVVL
jgi:sulfite reductase alpha subunit-like flavoprotein